jgi:hypothetical protein
MGWEFSFSQSPSFRKASSWFCMACPPQTGVLKADVQIRVTISNLGGFVKQIVRQRDALLKFYN